MNLNLHIVAADLERYIKHVRLASKPEHLPCSSLRPYEHDAVFFEGYIYVVESAHLPQHPRFVGMPSIICIGEPPAVFLDAPIDLIVAKEGTSPDALAGALAELFDRYSRWESRLRGIVDEGKPIEELGSISQPVFDNSLYCQASGFACVFLCLGNLEKARPELREWMLEVFAGKHRIASGEYLPFDAIDRLLADPNYIAASNAEGPTIYHHPISPGETYFINIGPAGAHVARVCVYEVYHALTSRDMALLCVLARYIELSLRSLNPGSYDNPTMLEQVTSAMLARNPVSDEEVHRALADIPWRVGDRYFCMVLESMSADQSWQTLQTIAHALEADLPGNFHCIYDGRLVYIFNLSACGQDEDQVLKYVEPAFRDAMLRAGSSEPFSDFNDLFYYHWQAQTACDIGRQLHPSFWYYRYRDCNCAAMLQRVQGDFPAEVFVPRGLRMLMAYDAEHDSELVSTLRAFLAVNCSVVETARATFVSRSTCIYRLKRINEVGRMNLEDSQVRLELNIAFALLSL